MASNYTRKKKKDAVFLNVKPIMNGDISVRKYSNGIMDQMHNGFRKQVYERANIRPSLATISSTNQQFIPVGCWRRSNVSHAKYFFLLLCVAECFLSECCSNKVVPVCARRIADYTFGARDNSICCSFSTIRLLCGDFHLFIGKKYMPFLQITSLSTA